MPETALVREGVLENLATCLASRLCYLRPLFLPHLTLSLQGVEVGLAVAQALQTFAPAVVRLSLPPVESAAGAAEGEAFQCNTWGCASKLGLQGKARLPACRPG